MSDWQLAIGLAGFFGFGFWAGYIWGRLAQRSADFVDRATAEEAEWEERKP